MMRALMTAKGGTPAPARRRHAPPPPTSPAQVCRRLAAALPSGATLVTALLVSMPLLAAEPEPIGDGVLTTLGKLILKGGVLMIPIGLASILMVGLAIERFLALRRARVAPVTLWREVRGSLEERNIGAARELAKESDTPLGRMLRSGLLHWAAGPAALSTALEDSGQREADGLQKHLAGLQGIASVAPLLGLLGTVFGMIKSFLSVAKEQALGNPERLAEGIGQALVTTAAGLTVAIPALVLYYLFRGRIRGLVGELDHVARSVTAFRQEGS